MRFPPMLLLYPKQNNWLLNFTNVLLGVKRSASLLLSSPLGQSSQGCCKIVNPSNTYLTLKSREIAFVQNTCFSGRQKIYNFVQSMAISLRCCMKSFKMTGRLTKSCGQTKFPTCKLQANFKMIYFIVAAPCEAFPVERRKKLWLAMFCKRLFFTPAKQLRVATCYG